ncbi:Nuclear receptor-binding protein like protein [Argiope bruennichi]|uniref:Nuclear receptor-binding protein like protein n=1 Tax=Argiope bruennichi TaxID=94029 RepID=A0A8T0FJY7_ARGBR|nr:Nuclear receptor-binding protein like protein [Argiope bruennichi]
MANALRSAATDSKNERESGDDSDDENENLEESPCGRWLKRKEEVQQRDIPGIDIAYLAMDTEEGVEVVWNEIQFSEQKDLRNQEGKIRDIFDSLIQLEHPNIVKFHKYWIDKESEKPRVIFITEYMSSGSLKQFLKKTKRNVIKLPLQAWKRWCSQILSALSYLHSCSPPIIHGNLTCDSIFIQHNGLLKIGSVAPEAIHHHIKTCQEDLKNIHFFAPEYGLKTLSVVAPAVDIYAFGMCALEDFILKCLKKNPSERPTARQLLFHPVIFEVHSLKLLSAHVIVKAESITCENAELHSFVINKCQKASDRCTIYIYKLSLKGLFCRRIGIYPLTAYVAIHHSGDIKKVGSSEAYELETRRIVNIMCNVRPQEDSQNLLMTILLRMDDKMNRQLSCEVSLNDTPFALAEELVYHGFINHADCNMVAKLISEKLSGKYIPDLQGMAPSDKDTLSQ